MNIRKNIDYSAMFAALDAALTAEMPQMQLCCELGRIVCSRPENTIRITQKKMIS